ncbi:MAG: response regulator [Gammaproteobacteria bacterium]|nr:response regulator [Gammaproteobacteria bacterium]
MLAGKQILIVDDDEDIRITIGRILGRDGCSVSEAGNGDEMRSIIAANNIDLIILDLMLPGEDGLSLARDLSGNNIPFIMLTGKDDVVDKIVGLELGADDYITKPFHARELTARVAAVLRRIGVGMQQDSSTATPSEDKIISFGEWSFNPTTGHLVSNDGNEVTLTTFEFQVLAVLATRPNRPLNRDQILDLVAEREWDPYDRSIDVLIGKIRKKLNDDPKNPKHIKTLRNLGYMFIGSSV